jgi:glycosyltransferase involved in cell wall biosynthesis
MRILYLTLENMSLHKGSTVHVKEVVNGLRQLGHHVGLIASSLDGEEETDHFYNLNVIPSFILRPLMLKRQPHIVSLLFLFLYLIRILPQYDVIYARDFHTVIVALLPRLIFAKKLVFEINGIANEEQRLRSKSILNPFLVFLIREAEKKATKYSERIVSVTPHIRTYLIENYHCALDKVRVVANGVNTKRFYPIYDEGLLWSWRKRAGIGKEDMVIAFVGNLAPWQGVETLIEIAPPLLKKVGTIRFLIIGDGVLREALKAKVTGLGVSDRFVFVGMVHHNEIPFYINISDICVLPKRRLKSGYSPIKLYEYMACGKPVVASRVEGLEFVEEERVGRLIKPEDGIDLEKTLSELIEQPQERLRMGKKGLQVALERFSWESKVVEIEEVLEELA